MIAHATISFVVGSYQSRFCTVKEAQYSTQIVFCAFFPGASAAVEIGFRSGIFRSGKRIGGEGQLRGPFRACQCRELVFVSGQHNAVLGVWDASAPFDDNPVWLRTRHRRQGFNGISATSPRNTCLCRRRQYDRCDACYCYHQVQGLAHDLLSASCVHYPSSHASANMRKTMSKMRIFTSGSFLRDNNIRSNQPYYTICCAICQCI